MAGCSSMASPLNLSDLKNGIVPVFYNSSRNGCFLFGIANGKLNRRQIRAARFCSGKALAVAVQPTEKIIEKKRRQTKERRVVVTGMGVVTPLGHDPDEFYNNLLEGASGISQIETFDCAAYPTAIRTGWVHPNINLDNPEKDVDPTVLVGSKKERLDVKVALSNSFGFGGHNSSILFAPFR